MGFTDYNHPLEVEARANEFLHTLSSFPKETLEQLQQLVQGTFQKELGASNATERSIWSPIVKKADEHVDWKDCEEKSEIQIQVQHVHWM